MIKFNIGGYEDAEFPIKKTIKRILKAVCQTEKITTKHVISYIFVTNSQIHEINLKYRKIDKETDVISFAMLDGETSGILPYELGDIFISIDKICSQAKEYGHSNLREFAFLVTHGTLHLLGYDHMNKEAEQTMFVLQDAILDRVKIYR